ncbi:hypothetical protein [Spongorhabdus nitratireducens]
MKFLVLIMFFLPVIATAKQYDIIVGMGNAHAYFSIVETTSNAVSLKPESLLTIETGRVIEPELWGLPSSMKVLADAIVVFEYGFKKAVKAFGINDQAVKQCRIFVGIAGYEAYAKQAVTPGEVTFTPAHQYLSIHTESASLNTREQYFKDVVSSILESQGFTIESNAFWMAGDQCIPGRIAQLVAGDGSIEGMVQNVDVVHAATCDLCYMIRDGEMSEALKPSFARHGEDGGQWQVGSIVAEKCISALFYDESGNQLPNLSRANYEQRIGLNKRSGAELVKLMALCEYASGYDQYTVREKPFTHFLQRPAGWGEMNELGQIVCRIAVTEQYSPVAESYSFEVTAGDFENGRTQANQAVQYAVDSLIRDINFRFTPGPSSYRPTTGEGPAKLVVVGEFPCTLPSLAKKLNENISEKLAQEHASRLVVVEKETFLKQFARAGQYEINRLQKTSAR